MIPTWRYNQQSNGRGCGRSPSEDQAQGQFVHLPHDNKLLSVRFPKLREPGVPWYGPILQTPYTDSAMWVSVVTALPQAGQGTLSTWCKVGWAMGFLVWAMGPYV